MSFTLKPARRGDTKLLLGLAGPTGSGKTLSSLYLASGIIAETGGQIAYIDTENGRALQYAPPGEPGIEFGHGSLEPPFSPDNYLKAYEAAEQHAGPTGVVIIDSVSHEHEGPGGVLEMHDQIVQDKGQHMQFAAWAQPKAQRRRLINRILQSRCHVILCFRSKEKSKQVKVTKNGREVSEIVDIGWQPITGDEWPYEATVFALLNPERKGVPVIEGFSHGKLPINMRGLIRTDRPLDVETGQRLAKWASIGDAKSAAKPSASAQTEPEPPAAEDVPLWVKDDRTDHWPPDEWEGKLLKLFSSAKSAQRLQAIWDGNMETILRLSDEGVIDGDKVEQAYLARQGELENQGELV